MAITIPIVTEFRDAGLKKAETEIQGFSNKIGAQLSKVSKQHVMAAGAAIGAFAFKAVNDFTNLGVEIGKFSRATGLASEEASRWVDLAGDFDISATDIQTSIMRMNKALGDGSPIFKALGIEIARTDEGLVDANQTFINAATTIGAIEDPTLKAKAAQEVFGRSYASISRIMGESADDLTRRLAEVPKQNIYDAKKQKQAEDFFQAMEDLKGIAEEFTLEVGQALIPILTDLFDAVTVVDAAIASLSGEDGGGITKLISVAYDTTGLRQLVDAINYLGEITGVAKDEVVAITGDMEVMQARANGLRREMLTAGANAETFATGLNEVEEATRLVDEAFQKLKGRIDDREAWRKFNETMLYFRGTLNPSQEQLDEFALALADVILELDTIPEEARVKLLAELEKQDFEYVFNMLEYFKKGATIQLRTVAGGGAVAPKYRAVGGPVKMSDPYIVGERGPELFIPQSSGRIVPNDQLQSGPVNVTINTSADPNEVVRAIELYRRRNGTDRI